MPHISISGRKRTNTNTQAVAIAAKRARRAVISGVVNDVLEAQQQNPCRSGSNDIIDKSKFIYPWLTKNMIYGSLQRLKRNKNNYIVRLGRLGSTSIIPHKLPK